MTCPCCKREGLPKATYVEHCIHTTAPDGDNAGTRRWTGCFLGYKKQIADSLDFIETAAPSSENTLKPSVAFSTTEKKIEWYTQAANIVCRLTAQPGLFATFADRLYEELKFLPVLNEDAKFLTLAALPPAESAQPPIEGAEAEEAQVPEVEEHKEAEPNPELSPTSAKEASFEKASMEAYEKLTSMRQDQKQKPINQTLAPTERAQVTRPMWSRVADPNHVNSFAFPPLLAATPAELPQKKKKGKKGGKGKTKQQPKPAGADAEGVSEVEEPAPAELSNDCLCVVCMENGRNVLFEPCHHLCTCAECYKLLEKAKDSCPLCRAKIKSIIVVYK